MPNDVKVFRGAGLDAYAGGFQVGAPRTYGKKPQIWTNSQTEIQKLLLAAFPKQTINKRQRERAGRWARIIHLYYRLNYTYSQVAEEIGATKSSVLTITRSIMRTRKGLRCNSNEISRGKPQGRPKKTRAINSDLLLKDAQTGVGDK